MEILLLLFIVLLLLFLIVIFLLILRFVQRLRIVVIRHWTAEGFPGKFRFREHL